MIAVQVRAYGDLNDFLRDAQRQREFGYRIRHPTSIKDLVESVGIPHPEIALLLVDGIPVGFDVLVDHPCRIAVYPRFSVLPLDEQLLLQPPLLDPPRFVLDGHLGKLARYLRLLGFDCRYDNNADDDWLARLAQVEERLLLTQDRRLLMRRVVRLGYYVRASDPRRQLEEVVQRIGLRSRFAPFTRCLVCNGRIEPVTKAAIEEQLEPLTRRYFASFSQCRACGRVYWQGSHYERLRQLVTDLTSTRVP